MRRKRMLTCGDHIEFPLVLSGIGYKGRKWSRPYIITLARLGQKKFLLLSGLEYMRTFV